MVDVVFNAVPEGCEELLGRLLLIEADYFDLVAIFDCVFIV